MYSLVVLKKNFFIGNNSFLPFLSASMLLYHNVIVNITERKLEYILLPLFRINLNHRQKSLPFLNRLSLGADVIMSKTALESIMAQNYKIPLAYIEYVDGIFSLYWIFIQNKELLPTGI